MREIWFGLVLLLGLGATPPAIAQAPQPADAATAQRLLQPTEQDRILGKPDAPITIVEYASLSCPHCAHFASDVLPKLKEKWIDSGKAKLIFRDFPLDEPALRAEMVLRCVPPGRFFALAESLFETQDKWVVAKDWKGALERVLKLGGISSKEFAGCVDNKKLEDEVAQSRLIAATRLGVDSTPTFFVNGQKYGGEPTPEAFDKLLSGMAGN